MARCCRDMLKKEEETNLRAINSSRFKILYKAGYDNLLREYMNQRKILKHAADELVYLRMNQRQEQLPRCFITADIEERFATKDQELMEKFYMDLKELEQRLIKEHDKFCHSCECPDCWERTSYVDDDDVYNYNITRCFSRFWSWCSGCQDFLNKRCKSCAGFIIHIPHVLVGFIWGCLDLFLY